MRNDDSTSSRAFANPGTNHDGMRSLSVKWCAGVDIIIGDWFNKDVQGAYSAPK